MAEYTPVAMHLNEFSTMVNQLSSVKIDFGDELCTLFLLVFFSEQLGSYESFGQQFYRQQEAYFLMKSETLFLLKKCVGRTLKKCLTLKSAGKKHNQTLNKQDKNINHMSKNYRYYK